MKQSALLHSLQMIFLLIVINLMIGQFENLKIKKQALSNHQTHSSSIFNLHSESIFRSAFLTPMPLLRFLGEREQSGASTQTL
jgi:hypothetical protein